MDTSTKPFVDGDRVTFTTDLGVIRTTDRPGTMTDLQVEAGDTGIVTDLATPLPDGWRMVRPDIDEELLADLLGDRPLEPGELLLVPVHPSMIEHR